MKNYGWIVDVAILLCVTYLLRVGILPVGVGIGMLSAIVGARVVVMRGGNPPAGGSVVLAVLLGLGYYLVGRHTDS